MNLRRGPALALMLLVAVVAGGCAATQPTSINLRCALAKSVRIEAGPDLATAFSGRLAAAVGLELLSQVRQKGAKSSDITYIVSLRSRAAGSVFVNVLFNEPYRTLAVTVSGDIANPEAGRISRAAQQVFSGMFPGATLAPFNGNQGLFGP